MPGPVGGTSVFERPLTCPWCAFLGLGNILPLHPGSSTAPSPLHPGSSTAPGPLHPGSSTAPSPLHPGSRCVRGACTMRACSVHNACVQCAQCVCAACTMRACSVHNACVQRAQCVRAACTMRVCSVHNACVQPATHPLPEFVRKEEEPEDSGVDDELDEL